jgi:putative membrane protein
MSTILFASTDGPGHWWFLLFPLVWIAVIALLIRFVFRRGGWGCRPRGGWSPGERARGILAERYARGEIGDDEYRTRLERLSADA